MKKDKDRFAGIVEHYALWISIDPDYDRIHESLRKMLIKEFRIINGSVIDVLEIGCGTGHTSKIILDADSRVRLTMIDKSAEMMEMATKNLVAYKNRYSVQVGDALRILPKLNQFPVIVSAQTIHNLHKVEQMKVYQCIYEGLLPGGVLLNGDKISLNDEKEYQETLATVRRRIKFVSADHPREREFFLNHEVEDDKIRLTENEVVEMLRKAGFYEFDISGRAGMHAIILARK